MSEDAARQKHYTRLPIQPILVMMRTVPREQFLGHLRCCAIKYLMRVDGKPLEEQQMDYAKARQYAAWAEEFARTGTIILPGQTERSDKAREVHHFYSDSGSDETADAKFVVDLLEELFPELDSGVDR